jgi:hypothetical protein
MKRILRMRERRVTGREVETVIVVGETLRDYPDDRPYPSRLVLGRVDGRPLHVVYAVNASEQEHIVITTYEPDPSLWDAEFRRKLKP